MSEVATATPEAPIIAPAAPAGLTATADDARVTLAWSAAEGADGYRVYRAEGDSSLALLATTPEVIIALSYTDTGAVNGNTYRYAVSAVNEGGESPMSEVATATPEAPIIAPAAPAGLTATADDAQVALAWSAAEGADGYRVYRAEGDSSLALLATDPEVVIALSYTDTGAANGNTYRYAVSAVNEGGESPMSEVATATPELVLTLVASPDNNAGSITLTWNAARRASTYTLYRALAGQTDDDLAIFATISAAPEPSYLHISDANRIGYIYAVAAQNSDDVELARSQSVAASIFVADSDGDGLIEITTIEELNNIRNNISGRSYRASFGDFGNTGGCPANRCRGYELANSLDFASPASYAAGVINSNWRPNNADPNMASNFGWHPIGDNIRAFEATFEGNGHTISGLYSRGFEWGGLFGAAGNSATIRGVGLVDVDIYGHINNLEKIGAIVGVNRGEIIESYATGFIYGDDSRDNIGGLVGSNDGDIIASYAAVNVFAGEFGSNNIGGLAGENTGSVIASYATGMVVGGTGDFDYVGGLVGNNVNGEIIASYATGNVDGGGGIGGSDNVGGLVGRQDNGEIIASYATGDVVFTDTRSSYGGVLVGAAFGDITIAGYGFGAVTGIRNRSTFGAPPNGITDAESLTLANAGAIWNNANSATLDAWHFGSTTQSPAVRYADYDGSGGDYSCGIFGDTLPDGSNLVCGATLIPGQIR